MNPAPVGIEGDRTLNVSAARGRALSPGKAWVGFGRLSARLLSSDGGEVDEGGEGGGAEHDLCGFVYR